MKVQKATFYYFFPCLLLFVNFLFLKDLFVRQGLRHHVVFYLTPVIQLINLFSFLKSNALFIIFGIIFIFNYEVLFLNIFQCDLATALNPLKTY